MTGVNVAFRIPRDSFVPEKIDYQLTAWPPDRAAGITRTIFTSDLRVQGREK